MILTVWLSSTSTPSMFPEMAMRLIISSMAKSSPNCLFWELSYKSTHGVHDERGLPVQFTLKIELDN